MIGLTNEHGKITYSEDVVINVVGQSTMQCYGVVGMAARNTTGGVWEVIKVGNLSKGVRINYNNYELSIELFVVVEYGTKISEIANSIIQTVRYNVEKYLGLKVSNIKVNIEGVRF